ncbi:tRNA wybutosine-synthesizing protein 4 [Hypsibius exemplaris]|uniref:tRNA wybutosine-synthesizing protein 4 n=1 Tax=Hypsibius exemplaris TaxID=2072580 RepID=A0A1W0WVG9_HYPEX|nr:tRNA wybutosine-synthesizing protein 4 [Hypsibius exemplaris]
MSTATHIDKQIQKTNDFSSVSKYSMCAAGYVDDRFLQHFVAKKVKRAPTINRGYYARMKAIDTVVLDFLNNANECLAASDEAGSSRASFAPLNIIVLGAGYDTLFFRLHDQHSELLERFTARYVEIDYLDVCINKSLMIQDQAEMKEFLYPPVTIDSVDHDGHTVVLESQNYALVGFDMRKTTCFASIFKQLRLDCSAPTLILAEVVLPYIDDSYVTEIFRTMAQLFENALFINYEQVEPTDPYGRFMMQHFERQKTPLLNTHRYPTVNSHLERFLSTGWKATACLSVSEFWSYFLPEEEKLRINALEPFDEHEEFVENLRHYVLALAATGDCFDIIENYRSPLSDQELAKASQRAAAEVSDVAAVPVSDRRQAVNGVVSDDPAPEFGLLGHASTEVKLLKSSGESVHVVVLVGGVPKQHEGKIVCGDGKIVCGDGDGVCGDGDGVCLMHDLGPGMNRIWISSAQLDKTLKRSLVQHAVVPHSTLRNTIFITGGRTSPLAPNLVVYAVEFSLDEVRGVVRFSVKKGPKTALLNSEQGSIRCQALPLADDVDVNMALAVQSLNAELQSSSIDYFHFEMKEDGPTVTQATTDTSYPARFASTALWGPRRVVISGGLRDDLAVSNIFLFDTTSDDWPYLGEMTFPRFGHTSHVYNDHLIVIGGVSTVDRALPDISVFNLVTKTEKHFRMRFPTSASADKDKKEPLVMLFNHTSLLISRNEPKRIVILGGGGNCFSFGTHFNSFSFYVELSAIL